jgi:hypothetical protein
VNASRQYFGQIEFKGKGWENAELLREVRKSASFKPGEALDLSHVRETIPEAPQRQPDDTSAR